MSLNRENVIWQSEDGTWSRGFYAFVHTGPDHEWDVEYNSDVFHWASIGHATEDAARAAWQGPNPGGSHWLEWAPENRTLIEKYDVMARTGVAAINNQTPKRQRRR